MDIKYIVLICFGALALFLCFLVGFFTKTEKVKTYMSLKSLASFSYVVLGLVCCNLVFKVQAYALFIIGALVTFMLSTIVRAIPTRSDMFHSFYTYIEGFAFGMIIVSLFFLIQKPYLGLIIAGGVFLAFLITYLVVKKKDAKKDKLSNLFLQLVYSAFFGIAIELCISLFTIQAILFAGAGLLSGVYVVLQTFTPFTNKKCVVAKNIMLGLALICITLTIFFI